MNRVVKVENLSKKYVISHQAKERYTALRDVMANSFKTVGRKLLSLAQDRKLKTQNTSREEIWALKDISFEVNRGDKIGIIGRNGAGKTTILKILGRITEPSEGEIRLRGRVGSLLEVGTGFHPELTGRENIFLNGAILGMTRTQINKKFDEIVDFAEIEKFLDTPVKRYSSGMYVRLAFAVAAHLETEILLVDEVLAVGDARFQKKCLGKMEDVSTKEGRTILFVSHNMGTITSLCDKTILLDTGQLIEYGKTSDVVLRYYSQGLASPASFESVSMGKLVGDDHASLISGAVVNRDSKTVSEVDIREPLIITMRFKINRSANNKYFPNFHFFSSDGTYAFVSSPRTQTIETADVGIYKAECMIPDNFLNEGTYFVGLALTSFGSGMTVHFYERNALSFNVRDPIENVPTRHHEYTGPIPGVVRPLLEWTVRRES